MGAKPTLQNFSPYLEKCVRHDLNLLDIVQSTKNLGPSQRICRPSWCPKLVTGLFPALHPSTNFVFVLKSAIIQRLLTYSNKI